MSSFNKMTRDLRVNKAALDTAYTELQETNLELEQRRNTIETILENIFTGVLSCGDKELQPGVSYKGDCATGEALAIFELTEDQVASDKNWPPEAVYLP